MMQIKITVGDANTEHVVSRSCQMTVSNTKVVAPFFPFRCANAQKPEEGIVHVITAVDGLDCIDAPKIIQSFFLDESAWQSCKIDTEVDTSKN